MWHTKGGSFLESYSRKYSYAHTRIHTFHSDVKRWFFSLTIYLYKCRSTSFYHHHHHHHILLPLSNRLADLICETYRKMVPAKWEEPAKEWLRSNRWCHCHNRLCVKFINYLPWTITVMMGFAKPDENLIKGCCHHRGNRFDRFQGVSRLNAQSRTIEIFSLFAKLGCIRIYRMRAKVANLAFSHPFKHTHTHTLK